ncbi:MAG: universal stress protein [Granulosicoccus sp.]|nr:universal stress protein [Granulosicoccus sp.]
MSYADILVTLDNSNQAQETLKTGIDLSLLFKAHLCAIYPVPTLTQLPYTGMAAYTTLIDQHRVQLKDEADTVGKTSRALADKQLVQLEWRAPEGDPETTVAEYGRLFDLVIFSQGDPENMQSVILGLSENILLRLGRPSLIIPHIGCNAAPFKRVLVAWDGGQAATRALYDAMPFLHRAESVEITTIYEADKELTTNANGNENICEHLLRHGIGATSTSIPHKDVDIASTLLNHVSDTGADLLVMGAYGHSRIRQVLLGGVTRSLLKHMTVPVLMSH